MTLQFIVGKGRCLSFSAEIIARKQRACFKLIIGGCNEASN